MSENSGPLGEYSAAMDKGDTEAVFAFLAPEFTGHVTERVKSDRVGAFYDLPATGDPAIINGTAILRMRDGKIVEHWGGRHCQEGLGLIR